MDHKLICKTMLYSYKDLEKRCEFIDELLLKRATKSTGRDTYEVFDELVDLINEKIAYCNIKVIIDEEVDTLKKNAELKSYHILGCSTQEIMKQFDISEKLLISRLYDQREALYKAILSSHNGLELFDIISDSRWLMKKYRELKEQELKGE